MIQRYNHLLELLDYSFKKYTNLPAYTCMGRTLTYGEVDELSRRFASYLHNDLDLQPGDRIAIQMPNILQYPVAMYGALRAGMVVVNTNPLYTGRELKHQLIDSGAKAVVVLANVADTVAKVIEETDVKHVIVTQLGDLHTTPKRQIINFVVNRVKKLVPKYSLPKEIGFRQTVADAAKPLKPFQVDSSSLMALQYTGGTTGISKGAMLTHGNLTSNVWQMITHLPTAFKEGEEVFIACLPLYHIYAFNLHGLCAFSLGEHNVLIPNPRDLDSMIATLKSIDMTVFIGINTLYVALSNHPEFKNVDFSKLHMCSAGGMAMTEDAAKKWEKITGNKISEGYGLTETSPVLCANKIDDIQKGTIGIPVTDTEIKLIDEDGKEVAPGEVGELCARGPQVMLGYWNRPNETAKVLSEDGWLRTGDMAMQRPDGHYKIVDRKKDMILVSGFNVYPNEIEDVVTQHDSVLEAAVVGIPDERTGEAVKLFIVPADKSLTVEEVQAYCRENLTAYKRPKIIEFREALPKTNVGKILRRELRESA
ncbi:Long-chain-fatty-acid--CoA ligase [Thalassocella blandensis]|nr:Long-chain-fatty-acid--CoA ligase [Thalassocella blandensis]